LLLWGAAVIGHKPEPFAVRKAGLFLFAGVYYTALLSFWALITRQDYLPFYPVAAVVVGAWLVQGADRFGRARAPWLLGAFGLLEVALILGGRPPMVDGTLAEREVLREVLELTRPGEYVMDLKGESVFRRRAFYYVMEPLTCGRIKHKMLEDTIARDVAAKQVHVVLNRSQTYAEATLDFLTENYLRVGEVRVAGRVLSAWPNAPRVAIQFPVLIPGNYVLWSEDGAEPRGLLDGTPYNGPRELAPGPHTFEPEAVYPALALFWERAAKAGYKPVLTEPAWQRDRT
jgi:hypothetical protein